MKVTDLKTEEYAEFYSTYITKVPKDLDLIDAYLTNKALVLDFFKSISNEKASYRYGADKWSIKEVFQHIIDNERIFTYRSLRLARQDNTPLSGYDQNDYINPSNADKKHLKDLIKEYEVVRESSIIFFKSLKEEDLSFIGHVSGGLMSTRAAAFITIGHEIHHINVLKARYL